MKRFILVLVLSCFFLLLSGSVSFAVPHITWTGFSEIDYEGNYYDFFNDLCITYYGTEFSNLSIAAGSSTTNANSLLTDLGNNTYQWFQYRIVYYNSSGINIYCDLYNSDGTGYRLLRIYRSTSSGNYLVAYEWRSGGSDINFTSDINDNLGTNNYEVNKYIVNTQNSTTNNLFYMSDYNTTNPPLLNLLYNSYKTSLMSINMGDTNQSFIKADYNLNGWINIGYLKNYKSYNEIQGYFGVYAGQSNIDNANYYDTIANFQYNKSSNQQFKNNLRLDYDTGNIYLNTQVCSYNHGYSLYFTGNGNYTTEVKYYYFVPIDSSASTGNINSDNPTGLDFDFINSIEYISQYESGNNQLIIDQVFKSGDDIFGLTYDDDNFDNWGFGDFVKTITNNFFNTVSNYNNVSLNFGYLGTISSSDFMRPQNNALFDIVSLFANSFLLLGCISFFYRTILSIATIDIDKLVKDDEDLIIL